MNLGLDSNGNNNFDRRSTTSSANSGTTTPMINDDMKSSSISSLSSSNYYHNTNSNEHKDSNHYTNNNNKNKNTNSNNNNNNNNNDNNSASLTSGIADMKQEKIIQDYVKLRSKLTILKKAYVELNESSVQKDQLIRKYEQEIESLNFRNQQLTSRVEILQRDLEKISSNLNSAQSSSNDLSLAVGGDYFSSSSIADNGGTSNQRITSSPNLLSQINNLPTSTTNMNNSILSGSGTNIKTQRSFSKLEVMSEELQHKISENVHLNRQLNEIEVEFRQKLAKNEQLLKQVEGEKLLLEKKLESSQTSSKSLIEKLQNDKIKLELNLIQLENQLRSYQNGGEKEKRMSQKNSESNQQQQQRTVAEGENSVKNGSNDKEKEANDYLKPIVDEESILFDELTLQIDCLGHVYSCLNEIWTIKNSKESNQQLNIALKCEQFLKQQLMIYLPNKLKSINDAVEEGGSPSPMPSINQMKSEYEDMLSQFFNLNHQLIETAISEMMSNKSTSSNNGSNDMEKVNKKMKIYLNKLVNVLFASCKLSPNSPSSSSSPGKISPSSSSLTTDNRLIDSDSFIYLVRKFIVNILFPSTSSLGEQSQRLQSIIGRIGGDNSSTNSKLDTFIQSLVDVLEKILFVYNEKLTLEYQLGFAADLTMNDEYLFSHLTKFKQSLVKLAGLLDKTRSVIRSSENNNTDGSNGGNINDHLLKLANRIQLKYYKQGADKVKAGLKLDSSSDMQKEIDDLKERLSVKQREHDELFDKYDKLRKKALSDFEDMDRLKLKLEKLQSQFMRLKDENERQMNELNEQKTLNNRQSELIKEQQDKEEKIAIVQPQPIIVASNSDYINEKIEKNYDNQQHADNPRQSEKATIDVYLRKIDDLDKQIRLLDSKAIFYYEQMTAALERLKWQMHSNSVQENELLEVKDQLERTRTSYEIQIRTMSDHLIDVNDKLTKQTEENEKLRHDLQTSNHNQTAAAAINSKISSAGKISNSKKPK